MNINITTEFISSRDNMLTRMYGSASDFIIPAQWLVTITLADIDGDENTETIHTFACRTKPSRKRLTRFIRYAHNEREYELYAIINCGRPYE